MGVRTEDYLGVMLNQHRKFQENKLFSPEAYFKGKGALALRLEYLPTVRDLIVANRIPEALEEYLRLL